MTRSAWRDRLGVCMGISFGETLGALREDLRRNIFFKSKLILTLFRLANFFACRSKLTLFAGLPLIFFYIAICEWVLGVEIPVKTKIGKGLVIHHGVGLVINGFCEIGDHCVVRHGVTIGNTILADGSVSGVPTIGDHVEFGANSIVLGAVRVGDRARIGAGAVVTKDIPDGAVAVVVPARVLDGHSI